MQLFFASLKFALLIYLLAALALYLLQDQLIFHPRPVPTGATTAFAQYAFTVPRTNAVLKGWLYYQGQSPIPPLVIYYGGNAEEISANIPDFQQLPKGSYLLMNYRGYGESTGKPSEKNLVNDALAIYDFVTNQYGFPTEKIFLMGRSLGSGVAVQVAGKRPVGGVILVTAFDSLLKVARNHYPMFPIRYLLRHPFQSAARASEIKIPLLNLMAGRDEVIPRRHAEALAERWAGPVQNVTIAQAGHNDISSYPEYWKKLAGFINPAEPNTSEKTNEHEKMD